MNWEEECRSLRCEVRELLALLGRIRQWDHLDSAADGPYWKREIDAALAHAAK